MTLCNKIFYCILLNNEIFTPKTSSTNIFGIVWSLTGNIRKFTYKFTYKCLSRFHRDKCKPKIYWQFTMSQNIGMIYKIKDNGFFKHLTSKLIYSMSQVTCTQCRFSIIKILSINVLDTKYFFLKAQLLKSCSISSDTVDCA